MADKRWIMVCGGPKTGKSTLARKMIKDLGAGGFISTDDFLAIPRGERPFAIANRMRSEWEYGDLIIVEGCEAPRLLDRLPLLDLPVPHRVVWVGPEVVASYPAQYRALVAMQVNKIVGAVSIGLLSELDLRTNEGNLIYVPSYSPQSDRS